MIFRAFFDIVFNADTELTSETMLQNIFSIYPNFLKLIMYVKSAIPCSEKLESMNYAGKNSIFLAEMESTSEKPADLLPTSLGNFWTIFFFFPIF